MSIRVKKTKTPRKTQKQQLTQNQKHTKYQNSGKEVPVFTFSMSSGAFRIPVPTFSAVR